MNRNPSDAQLEALALAPQSDSGDENSYRSPLWMVTREPALNEFVSYLDNFRALLSREPDRRHELVFSREQVQRTKDAFAQMIRRGEESLHKLSEILCHNLLKLYQIQSVVFGEVETTRERFTLAQNISPEDLYSTTDIDLGNRQLQKLRFFDGKGWSKALLVANVVEYQPTDPNRYSIHRVISRIKAEEEIWNKVVDEIFGLDFLVRRDKKLWYLSRYVKDVFGLKIVVGGVTDARKLHDALLKVRFTAELLEKFGIPGGAKTDALEFIEVKDYMGQNERKDSGWEALKSVVSWGEKTFEIQVQPLKNFFREREYLTKESHVGFKSRRESVRDQIALEVPLFGFYRDLLRWLFLDSQQPPPIFDGIKVVVRE